MQLKVQTLTGKVIVVEAQPVDSIEALKTKIEQVEGLPVQLQRLIFAGKELQNEASLASYSIEEGCVLHLVLRKVEVPQTASGEPGQPGFAPAGYAAYPPATAQPSPYGGGVAGGHPVVMVSYGAGPYNYNIGMGMGGLALAPVVHGDAPPPAGAYPLLNPDLMHQIFHTARAVKMFAIIDAIFLVIWSFSYWPLVFGVVLVLAGYYGAHHYRTIHVAVYLFYLFVSVGFRVWWITGSQSVLFSVVIGVGILIEIYIIRIVSKFFSLIKNLSEQEKIQLRLLQSSLHDNV